MSTMSIETKGPLPLAGLRIREERLRKEISRKIEEIRGWDWYDQETWELLEWLERDWDPESGMATAGDAFDASDEIFSAVDEMDGMQGSEWEEVAGYLRSYAMCLASLAACDKDRMAQLRACGERQPVGSI